MSTPLVQYETTTTTSTTITTKLFIFLKTNGPFATLTVEK
jgi:hypothetical protein